MKTKNLLFIPLCSFFFFYSCKKNEPVYQNSSAETIAENVENINGRLAFKSFSDYETLFEAGQEAKKERLLNVLNESTSYTSMRRFAEHQRTMYSEKVAIDSLYPEFLLSILNSDGIVQIDEYLIKIDMQNSLVLTLNKTNQDQYADLVTNNLLNKNIKVFSTSDDVLEILKSENISNNAKTTGLFCKDRKANEKSVENNPENNSYTGANGNSYAAKIEQRYQKAGIYFSLFSKIKNLYWNGAYWNYNKNGNTSLTFTYYNYKKRCGYSQFNSVGFTVNDNDDSNSKDGVVTYRLYESATNLKYYSLTTYFRYDDNNNSNDGDKIFYANNISDF